MSKLMMILTAAAVALGLAACGAPSAGGPALAPTAAATAAAEAVAPTAAAPTAAVTVAPTTAPAATEAATSAPAAPAGEPVSSPLAGTAWRLTFLGSQEEPALASRELQGSITFAADGTLSGSTGCAAFTGRYTADEAALAVSDVVVAEGSCASPEAQEQAELFAELLPQADGFSIEGVVLTVTVGDSALWFQE
jgi:heat shock protein HslJ